MKQQLWANLPRLPWRIATTHAQPVTHRDATPILCLPQTPLSQREDLLRRGYAVWSFDYLGSGASDHCLGSEPTALRQIAAVVVLIQATSCVARVTLLARNQELADAQAFAAAYPFAIDRIIQGDDHDAVQRYCGDLRSAAA